jgi:hypothetical protein
MQFEGCACKQSTHACRRRPDFDPKLDRESEDYDSRLEVKENCPCAKANRECIPHKCSCGVQ